MWLLRSFALRWLWRRLTGGGSRRNPPPRGGRFSGGGGRQRGRGGLFPFPHYSTRTRRGSSVSVGGCCLPLALSLLAAPALALHAAVRR